MRDRDRALLPLVLVYALALGVLGGGFAYGRSELGLNAYWAMGLGDLLATFVVFGASLRWRNSSFYDPYWSVLPPVMAALWWWSSGRALGIPELCVVSVLLLWGVRLTSSWWRGWSGVEHEDWRYRDLRAKTGAAYFLVNLSGIHLFPTALVFAGCYPAYRVLVAEESSSSPLMWAGLALALASTWLEARADVELHRFKKRPDPKAGEILRTGVWAWSRHPNYAGEIGLWWGIALIALGSLGFDPWLGVGGLAMWCLFQFISIPLIETRASTRREGWDQYKGEVPRLLPQPWRGRAAKAH